MEIQLILIACIVNFGRFTLQSRNQMADNAFDRKINSEKGIRENFQNLFDSIAQKNSKESGIYRELLKLEVTKEKQAFDAMKKEIQNVQSRNSYRKRRNNANEYVVAVKRQAKENNTGTFNASLEMDTLFEAAECNDLEKVKFFVEVRGAPLSLINDEGQTLGHIGARNNNLDLIKYVLSNKKERYRQFEGRDMYLHFLLQLAVRKNSVDVVKYLVANCSMDPMQGNCPDYRTTALHTSIQYGHLSLLKYFIEERGCDVNIKDWQDTSLVFFAVKYGHSDILEYLVEEKHASLTTIDRFRENILYSAARTGNVTLVKYLLDDRKAELDINWRNEGGETVVLKTVDWNQTAVLKYLVSEKHADINIPDNWHLMTPLHHAASKNNFEIFTYLVEHGADTQFRDDSGHLPVEKTSDERIIAYVQNMKKG